MSIYDPDEEIVKKIRDAYHGKLPLTVNLEEFNLNANENTSLMLEIASRNAVNKSHVSTTITRTPDDKVKAITVE